MDAVGVCAVRDEEPDDVEVSVFGHQKQGGVVTGAAVHVQHAACLEQFLHDLNVTVFRGVQKGIFPPSLVRIGTGDEQHADRFELPD